MTFRRKNGLCYKCGEKWGHNHKCPQQVSLHVIEELWDALEHSDEGDTIDSDDEPELEAVSFGLEVVSLEENEAPVEDVEE